MPIRTCCMGDYQGNITTSPLNSEKCMHVIGSSLHLCSLNFVLYFVSVKIGKCLLIE